MEKFQNVLDLNFAFNLMYWSARDSLLSVARPLFCTSDLSYRKKYFYLILI